MKKLFSYIFILVVISGFILPQTAQAVPCTGIDRRGNAYPPGCEGRAEDFKVSTEAGDPAKEAENSGLAVQIAEWFLKIAAQTILKLASYLSGLAGIILNGVVFYTIVHVSDNYAKIDSIASTWKVVRDIANMGFIFVLLYAAINTILGTGQDNKRLIVNVVIVAVLINFSLFFTRLIIDASNILALTFYDAIAPNALNIDANWTQQAGLSNAFMQHLNLQSLWKAPELDSGVILTVGVMGTIMLLIAAFVFFAIAIMFIIRYVILILVLVLSPIAFIAHILPKGTGIDKYKNQWWDALLGQAFFAPIYFMLTWVTLSILSGITTSFGTAANTPDKSLSGIASVIDGTLDSGAFIMLINFIIVIVLLIASLLVAKEWANKAGGGMGKLTSWVTGAAGAATIGTTGWLGRRTLGVAGEAVSSSERLKEKASRGGAGGMMARLALATGKKAGASSFDFRATRAGEATVGMAGAGKAGGKGGFIEFKKKQAEEAEKRAKALGPSQVTLDQAEQAVKRAGSEAERRAAQAKLDQLKGYDDKKAREILIERGVVNPTKDQVARVKDENKGEGEKRKQAYAKVMENSWIASFGGYNTAAAAQIRKGKSKEKKLAEAYKEIAKDEEGGGEPETPTPPATPPTGGPAPTP